MPRVQAKSHHGAHWFDPFGSVGFSDLCNVPPVANNTDAVRYLFWDQEPLHQELVDQTLGSFVNMFDCGQRHIITSEYASENVDYIHNTYGFIPHYYFFHGWAALDWYRGYNRSYLMPAERTITKTFISPNRIIAGQRKHRLLMLYHMFKNKLEHNWISCPDVCPAEQISIAQAVEPLLQQYPDIRSVFDQVNLPLNFPGETGQPMHSYQLSLFNESAESLLYLVSETVASGRRQHLTEKTFKPICLRMPFVLVACAGSLEYLKRYGFKTFDSLWSEDYDHKTDKHVRIARIGQLLKELDQLSPKEKQQLYTHAQPIVEHNFDHFYSGGFEQILWQELTSMLKAMNV